MRRDIKRYNLFITVLIAVLLGFSPLANAEKKATGRGTHLLQHGLQ